VLPAPSIFDDVAFEVSLAPFPPFSFRLSWGFRGVNDFLPLIIFLLPREQTRCTRESPSIESRTRFRTLLTKPIPTRPHPFGRNQKFLNYGSAHDDFLLCFYETEIVFSHSFFYKRQISMKEGRVLFLSSPCEGLFSMLPILAVSFSSSYPVRERILEPRRGNIASPSIFPFLSTLAAKRRGG